MRITIELSCNTQAYGLKQGRLSILAYFQHHGKIQANRFEVKNSIYHWDYIKDINERIIGKRLVIDSGQIIFKGGHYFTKGVPPLLYSISKPTPIGDNYAS